MNEEKIYNAAVIGGGLAGLCVSVLLAQKGFSVILFEKEKYPFHKVCGEYISMESWEFLSREIGLPLDSMHLPKMNSLLVTAPNGNSIMSALDTGGFGISRFKLDNLVKETAEALGVKVYDGCKAYDVIFDKETFTVKTTAGEFKSRICCGSWGKKSNLDVKWKRSFLQKDNANHTNYVGIKYHVSGEFAENLITLHNFKDGYCGFSKVEDEKYCFCYFTKASNLAKGGHGIDMAEKNILSRNPHLKKLLQDVKKINKIPFTISQVSLSKKKAVESHVLMLGDAAGMISPLCGNGMSIAMHSAKLAAKEIVSFLQENISRQQMENNYSAARKQHFGRRIATGRFIQSLFGRERLTNVFVSCMKRSKWLTGKVIGLTHGKNF